MLQVVVTRPAPGPEFSFRTRYPARLKNCLLVPPLIMSKKLWLLFALTEAVESENHVWEAMAKAEEFMST